MSEKFVGKAVDENGDGLDVQMGSGGTSGLVTEDSETFRLDNWESEINLGFASPCNVTHSTE
jgi:hypothetical protein